MSAADPGDVLAALPDALWPALLQGVRKAADRLGRAQLPPALQPYAGFTPAKLRQDRPRAAVMAAVAEDARLRDAIGRALGEPLWSRAAEAAVEDLVAQHGSSSAAAALAARGRWDELAALAAATASPALAARNEPSTASTGATTSAKGKTELAALRRERDAAVRGRTAAERRATDLASSIDVLREQITQLTAERDAALARADDERSRLRDRLARLQRRVSEAESQARADRTRVTDLAAELERLVEALRDPAGGPAGRPEGSVAPAAASGAPVASAVPRQVRGATPGRPSALPPGVTDSQPLAVSALLDVPGIEVVLDGYNITKDLRGVPALDLIDQRAWLLRIAAAVAASRDVRMTVVFDGEGERTTAESVARIVRCMYTAEQETADDRIVALVTELPPDAPVLVVTSDREVRARTEQFGANVVAAGVFLQAVG